MVGTTMQVQTRRRSKLSAAGSVYGVLVFRHTHFEMIIPDGARAHLCTGNTPEHTQSADTKIKKAFILHSWKEYQSSPIPIAVFERWKELGLFAYAIGLYQVRYGEVSTLANILTKLMQIIDQHFRRYAVGIEKLFRWKNWLNGLIEQHKDNLEKGHIYVLSTKPFPTKASDKGKPDTANKIATNEIPAIEVKNVGSLSFAWNSMHESGCRYDLVNETENPVLCDVFPEYIDRICKKYGLEYLDEHGKGKPIHRQNL